MKKWLINNIPWLVPLFVVLLCIGLALIGTKAEDGSITLNGKPAEISEGTKEWQKEAEKVYIKYAEKAVPALLADGTYINVPTVEYVDGPAYSEEKCEEGQECDYYLLWLFYCSETSR